MDVFDTLRGFTRVRREIVDVPLDIPVDDAGESPAYNNTNNTNNTSRTKSVKKRAHSHKVSKISDNVDEPPTLAQIISRATQAMDTPNGESNGATTITDIVAMIPAGMTAVTDSRGYIADSSTIAVACTRAHAHIHKYFLSDVARGSITCQTCTYGTKFVKMAREIAEELLAVGFIADGIGDFVNIPLGITLRCHRVGGIDNCHKYNDATIHINLYQTESRRKVVKLLHEYLHDYPKLSVQQKSSLEAAVGKKKVATKSRPLLRRRVRDEAAALPTSLYLEEFIIQI